MEATTRRSSSRLPASAALLLLGIFSILLISSSAGSSGTPSRLHRRDSGLIFVRQEESPTPSAASSSEVPEQPSPSSSIFEPSSTSVIPSSSSAIPSSSSRSSSSSSPSRPTTTAAPPTISTSSTSVPLEPSSSEEVSLSSSSDPSSSESILTSPSPSVTASSGSPLPTQPSTTLIVTNEAAGLIPTGTFSPRPGVTPTDVPEESATPDDLGASSQGFFANKGAVAATFTVVSLVAVGLIAVAIITFLKRRSQANQRKLDDELFGDRPVSDGGDGPPTPGGSIHEKPLDPFSSRDVVYNSNPGFQGPSTGTGYALTRSNNVSSQDLDATVRPYQEQTGYIAAGTPSEQSHASGHTAYWTPNPSQQTITAPAQYILPSQAQTAANANYYASTNYNTNTPNYYDTNPATTQTAIPSAPPVAFKNPPVRESVDSFYGYTGNQQQQPYASAM